MANSSFSMQNGPNKANIQMRFRNALEIFPLRRRITEVLAILNESTLRELEFNFQILVEHIFGATTGTLGWNLKQISRLEAIDDFETIISFLHPAGPLFEFAYKLLGDVYLKYHYSLSNLPQSFLEMIKNGNAPPFFAEKINFDPNSRTPTSLLLNSFELYMFHFTFHLVSPAQRRPNISYHQAHSSHDTIYLHLWDFYLAHFLPIETSSVLPMVLALQHSPRSPPPQVQPVKISRLFKESALKDLLAVTAQSAASQPHAEIWRSESIVHLILYFWLYLPDDDCASKAKQMSPSSLRNSSFSNSTSFSSSFTGKPFGSDWHESRASSDHLRVIRSLVKHMHYFANNLRNDGTTMDDMRRSIRGVLQRPLVTFLKHNIENWPLDSSFILILETYLSYIQPWRYQRYSPGTTSGISTQVGEQWLPFIIDNLEAYVPVVAQIMNRFSRMDLSSPRHSHMVYRLFKVLAEPQLPILMYNAEVAAYRRAEPEIFMKYTMTSEATERQAIQLLATVKATEDLVTSQETLAREKRTSSFMQSVQEWFLGSSTDDDYSSADRQATLTYLEHATRGLETVFNVTMNSTRISDDGAQCAASVEPSLLDPVLAHKRAALLKFEGNPDVQPICSFEIPSMVRFFLRVSKLINDEYGPSLAELWHRPDIWGGVSRQLLAAPRATYHFVKTGPGNPAPRVATPLPPRVCLRPLASQRFITLFIFLIIFPYLFNYTPILFYLTMILLFALKLFVRALLAPYFEKEENYENEVMVPLDVSFNE